MYVLKTSFRTKDVVMIRRVTSYIGLQTTNLTTYDDSEVEVVPSLVAKAVLQGMIFMKQLN